MVDKDDLYKDATPNLFRDWFSRKAKGRDDELKVLRSTRPPTKKPTNWRGKDSNFFQGCCSYTQATRSGGAFRGYTTPESSTGPGQILQEGSHGQPPEQPKLNKLAKNFRL